MELSDLLFAFVGLLFGALLTSAYYMERNSLVRRLYVGVGRDSYGWYWRAEAVARRFRSQKEAVEDLNSYGITDYTEE